MPLTVQARSRVASKVLAEPDHIEDDELVELVREGDTDALDVLLHRYTSYARAKAKTYFLVGADREDIVQEGMIGLFKAIRDYETAKTASFRSFAELCITRQIITAIKGATRQKHQPLNQYVSLHRPSAGEDDGDRELVEFLASARVLDPVEQIVAEDEVAQIRAFLADILSDLEVDVLNQYLEGRSYQEIAKSLRRQAKSIDNALQRIKRKLEGFLEGRKEEHDSELAEVRQLHVGRYEAAASTSAAHHENGSNGNGSNGNGSNEKSRPESGDRKRATARSGDLRASLRMATKAAARRGSKAAKRAPKKRRSKAEK